MLVAGCTTELGAARDGGRPSIDAFAPRDVLAPPLDAVVSLDTFAASDVIVLSDAWVPYDASPMPTLDVSGWTVMNSPTDIGDWAETATITGLVLGPDGVHIDFTKRDGAGSWPDVPFVTPGENLEYTLWIVLRIGGQWYTSGCLQYWRGLDQMGGPPSMYAGNWYYDPGRWGVMSVHQPVAGEWVGFFVAAGNERNVTDHSGTMVLERSNIVLVPFPSDTGATFVF